MNPEIYIALVNIQKLLGLTKLTINKSDVAKSVRFEKDLNTQTLAILKGKVLPQPDTVKLAEIDVIIEKVKDLSIEDRAQSLALIADEGVINPVIDTLTYLQNTLPETEGASELARYTWKCRVVNDPLWVLYLISTSQLTPLDIACLEQVYPDIYNAMVTSFMTNLVENLIDINTLSRPLKLMLGTLLKTPILNSEVVKAYQISDNVRPTELKVQ